MVLDLELHLKASSGRIVQGLVQLMRDLRSWSLDPAWEARSRVWFKL
jgi:hypothetical protein